MTPIFSHMDFRTTLAGILLLLGMQRSIGQQQTVTVPVTGSTVFSAPLEAGRLYRLIIEGSASVGITPNCTGVDALYIYDIPNEEVERGHLPSSEPIYVGDDNTWVWSTKNAQRSFSPVRQVGLRVNGMPVPKREYERDYHRYMMELLGTGEPLTFSFLDEEYLNSDPSMGLVDASANNCGSFTVTITDVHPVLQTICDVMVERRGPEGRRMKMHVPRPLAHSTLYVNGMPATVDSVSCPPLPPPSSTFFLLDRSGSLRERDAIVDGVRLQRSEVMDIALRRAFLLLQQTDTVAMAGFSNVLAQPTAWTSPPRILADSLDVAPIGATNIYGSLLSAVALIRRTRATANIIMITDGGNNFPEYSAREVVDGVNSVGGRLGVVLLPDATPEATNRNLMDMEANLRGVDHLLIRRADGGSATAEALGLLMADLDLASCCELTFTLPLCTSSGFTEQVTIQLDSITLVTDIPCTPPLATERDVTVRVLPTPSDERATIEIETRGTGTFVVDVYDVGGKLITSFDPVTSDPGIITRTIDTRFWANCVYCVVVTANGSLIDANLLVLH